MDQSLLKDVKSVLRALIISSPRGLTMEQLNRDYREAEGRYIPFAKLGFPSLEGFLRSLTDTLVVHQLGSATVVSSIPSEKTAHIERLVAKQKSTKKASDNTPKIPKVWNKNIARNPLANNQYNAVAQNVSRQQPSYKVPDFYNNPQALQAAFSQKPLYGHFNAPPMNNFLVNANGLFIPMPLQNTRYLAPQQQYQAPYKNYSQTRQNNRNSYNKNNSNKPLNTGINDFVNKLLESEKKQNMKSKDLNEGTLSGGRKQEAAKKDVQDQCIKNVKRSDPITANEKLKIDDVAAAFAKVKLENVEDQLQLGRSFTETNSICTTKVAAGSERESSSESSLSTAKSNSRSNHERESSGNSSNDSTVYKNKNGKIVSKESQDQTANGVFQSKEFDFEHDAIPDLPSDDIVFSIDFPVSTSICKFGDKIPPSKIPSEIENATDVFGIFVTEVHNPYRFWFHFTDEVHYLDDLMKSLEDCYTGLIQNELQLKHACARPGQACAALFYGLWHRGEVIDTPKDGMIKIFFVDYGTVYDVPLHHVKYLMREYAQLPCQALRGSLAYIKPKGHRWTRNTSYTLLSLVSDKYLFAKRVEIRKKEKIVSMILIDTNGDDDVQINDALVRKGHAKLPHDITFLTVEDEMPPPKSLHFQEVYPTFESLETGKYPSFYNIGVYLSKGIDIEAFHDSIIVPDVDSSLEDVTRAVNIHLRTNNLEDVVEKESDNEISKPSNINEKPLENVIIKSSVKTEENVLNNVGEQFNKGNNLLLKPSTKEYENNLQYNDLNITKKTTQKNIEKNHFISNIEPPLPIPSLPSDSFSSSLNPFYGMNYSQSFVSAMNQTYVFGNNFFPNYSNPADFYGLQQNLYSNYHNVYNFTNNLSMPVLPPVNNFQFNHMSLTPTESMPNFDDLGKK